MEKTRPLAPRICFLILGAVLLLLYVPVFYLMLGSVVEKINDSWGLTSKWYQEVFADEALQEALVRSVLVAFGASFLSTALGTGAAIVLWKTKWKLNRLLEFFASLSLVMPELVFALSLLSWFFILKLELSLWTVLIAHVSFTLSFVIFAVSSRLGALDSSLDEAAADLGATPLQTLLKVTLPLLRPALVTSIMMSFLLSFDDFLITFFTSGAGADTLPVKLYNAMRIGHSPKLNALSTLMIVFSVASVFMLIRSRSFREILRPK